MADSADPLQVIPEMVTAVFDGVVTGMAYFTGALILVVGALAILYIVLAPKQLKHVALGLAMFAVTVGAAQIWLDVQSW